MLRLGSTQQPEADFTHRCAGGTGYIGSLVVEQLLRTVPDVAKIYLIIRSKGGNPAKARLERLLNSGLFHMVRDDLVLRSKAGILCSQL